MRPLKDGGCSVTSRSQDPLSPRPRSNLAPGDDEEMVGEGWASHYVSYSDGPRLPAAETGAQKAPC